MAYSREYLNNNGSFNTGQKQSLLKTCDSVDFTDQVSAAVAAAPATALTDNSGGTASDTIAAISDTATKTAVASLAAKVNALIAAFGDLA